MSATFFYLFQPMFFKLKNILAALLACLSCCCASAAPYYFSARLPLYAGSSKLASGKWVKVMVRENGVYKLTFDELRKMGFKNPEKVHVYGYGGNLLDENLTQDYLDDVPEIYSYLGDSFILFYGVGTAKWTVKNPAYPITNTFFTPVRNSYADYGAYFLAETEGVRPSLKPDDEVFDIPSNHSYAHYSLFAYLPHKVNIFKGGVAWFDDPIRPSGSQSFLVPFNAMVDSGAPYFAVYQYIPDSDKLTYDFSITSGGNSAAAQSGYVSILKGGPQKASAGKLDLNLRFTTATSSLNSYTHYVVAAAYCHNTLTNGCLYFNNRIPEVSKLTTYHVGNVTPGTQVWNVSKPGDVRLVNANFYSDSLEFVSNPTVFSQYVALDPDNGKFLSVDSFATVTNQNLHALKGADLVIISPKDYFPQAYQLAALHEQYDGISSLVVTQEQVFNEFSSGVPDPTAFRSFLKMMYDRALSNDSFTLPKYLLLFGDGCFDNRGVARATGEPVRNLVLTYQYGNSASNFPADDYYGMLADNTLKKFSLDTCLVHVAVGRLPFTNASQASNAVEKIGRYMKEDVLGKWKMNTVILADDNESAGAALSGSSISYHEFLSDAEVVSRTISSTCPAAVQNKVYFDSYTRVSESSGFRYPEVESKLVENISNGALYINYIGHSNPINWSAEKVFTQSQVASLNNKKLGVWFSASCDFSEYDNYSTACGEALVLEPSGGAIAVVATSRATYSNENCKMDTAFSHAFFAQKPGMAIGDLMRIAKNNVKQSIRVKYPLMGDPAVRIHFPAMKVVTDSLSADTLKAMSKVSLAGHIEDDSVFMSAFNGRVNVTVFDKIQKVSTKGNLRNMVTTYDDYTNVIYSGETDVVDGRFSLEFLVPNDISYDFGKGHIAYYAFDEDNGFDAVGNDETFVVGGASDAEFSDEHGPIVRAYVNAPSFHSGDVVGKNPVLVVEVHDENGINASGIGLGHDITVSLNGADKVKVNEYFAYDRNSYTSGKVVYPLGDLADGTYSLEFKSWDMLGNSSLSTLVFTVANGKGTHINNILASENPARESTSVHVSYDRLLTNVSYNVAVYSLSGVLVRQFSGNEFCKDGELVLDWDLTDAAGRRVQPGVYVYRVDLESDGTAVVGASEKIVVLPQ